MILVNAILKSILLRNSSLQKDISIFIPYRTKPFGGRSFRHLRNILLLQPGIMLPEKEIMHFQDICYNND